MKVILNEDVKHLGEEGDVKDVAPGYARNYLFPRNLAVIYNKFTVAYFESRKEQIEARKVQKRQDAMSLKEKLEALSIVIPMPAGPSGKLYGAVTSQTIADELQKQGQDIERKRIDVPGNALKSAGNYTVQVRLYENAVASLAITVEAILPEVHTEPEKKQDRKPRHKREAEAVANEASNEASSEASASAETPATDSTANVQ